MEQKTPFLKTLSALATPTVLVAALGYFVDIYDLILFGMVRRASLATLGFTGDAAKATGDFLLDMQMIGLLLGGIFWGVLGDKKGRRSVLFGSIVLYSVANIANGFVTNIPMYALLRFVAGVGLAGELGAGITLVNETMSKENRGWGTMLVVSVGALGAVAAAFVGNVFGSWQISYWVGGGLGLLLLLLRVGTFESGMFQEMTEKTGVFRGNLRLLFSNKKRLLTYLACIGAGLPVWFSIGILVLLGSEFMQSIHVEPAANMNNVIAYAYAGLAFGDFLSAWLSQVLRSRKKVVAFYIGLSLVFTIVFTHSQGISATGFYLLYFLLGCCNGYWVTIVTMASEQFGTNIRATVTTTVPNFIRGAVIPITLLFRFFEKYLQNNLFAALIVGVVCALVAAGSVYFLKDTFGRDLDFLEQ